MAAAGASEVAPVELVGNYINLSSENPEQAKTLLLPDAAYMIFDYGGSLADFFSRVRQTASRIGLFKANYSNRGKTAKRHKR